MHWGQRKSVKEATRIKARNKEFSDHLKTVKKPQDRAELLWLHGAEKALDKEKPGWDKPKRQKMKITEGHKAVASMLALFGGIHLVKTIASKN